jgi:hypothetical protein
LCVCSLSQLFASQHIIHALSVRLFSTMRRGIHNLFVRKPSKKVGQAAAIEDAYDATDEPLDNTQFGLGVLVEGVNSIVEYVSLSVLSVSSASLRRSHAVFLNKC